MNIVAMAGWVLAGLAPLAAAAGLPAATPSPTMIFFDWGKSDIQRDYTVMLDSIATAYLQAGRGTVMIEGHSDRSGSAAANLQSSRQRARLVRDYLVGKGIPTAAITVRGSGEDHPFVATADGVREAQNRRVDVVFTP